jgi:hypothetical protein
MLSATRPHAREDVVKISDPKAHALCETSAEVLLGLVKAFEDFEQKSEKRGGRLALDNQRPGRFRCMGGCGGASRPLGRQCV